MMLKRDRKQGQQGFTLVELVMVVAILLVIAAFATPYMVNVIANIRLRGGMTSLAGLFQESRTLAIKNNRFMSTHFTTMASGPVAFIKDPTLSTQTLASTDPQVELGAPVTYVTSLTGVTGAPTSLDSTYLGYTPQTGSPDPTFNPRGLPCNYSSGACTTSGGSIGYVYYFTDTRPLGKNGWGAVSISPAGRVRVWMWTGTAWGG